MLRWLLVPFLIISLPHLSTTLFAAEPDRYSTEPAEAQRKTDEASLLWDKAQDLISKEKFEQAIAPLSRLVEKYPAFRSSLEAEYYLSLAYFQTGKFSLAIDPLKKFNSVVRSPLSGAKGKLLLSKSYLNLKQWNEAYLAALETDQMIPEEELPLLMLLEKLWVKSYSMWELRHELKALIPLQEAETAMERVGLTVHPEIRAEIMDLRLKIKIWQCFNGLGKTSLATALDEKEIRAELDQRGTCLIQSVLLFRPIVQTSQKKMFIQSIQRIVAGFSKYLDTCGHFTRTYTPKKKNRSGLEFQRYKLEMADILLSDGQKKLDEAIQLLVFWSQPPDQGTTLPFEELIEKLKRLKK